MGGQRQARGACRGARGTEDEGMVGRKGHGPGREAAGAGGAVRGPAGRRAGTAGAAHSAAQPEHSAHISQRSFLCSPVKSVFREGTRQETFTKRKEQREDHLVGRAAAPLQMVQCGHQLAREEERRQAAAPTLWVGGPRTQPAAHQQLPGQKKTLGPLATTSLADPRVENGACHTWKLFSQNKGS